MIEYIKDLIEKIKNGMLKEMYIEGKWIAKYIYKYKWGVVFYIFLGILGTILGLISSVFSKNLKIIVIIINKFLKSCICHFTYENMLIY